MLILLSPAKNIIEDPRPSANAPALTQPRFLEDTNRLVSILQKYSEEDFSALTGVSSKLAALNITRYATFPASYDNAALPPAVGAFNGDVYRFLKADDFTNEEALRAQIRLRILSGLYGLLRPYDAMHPYRLEMGTALANSRGKNLYAFWGDNIARMLESDAASAGDTPLLVNLASTEYAKAALQGKPNIPVITMHFKEIRKGTLRTIALNAKRARGMAAGWIIRNNINNPDALDTFNEGGYVFRGDLSSDTDRVFVRPEV